VFAWRFLDASGDEVGTSDPFEDREDAESWMGTVWGDLRERGVEEVVLTDQDGRRVYRMGLEEAEA
jgi:hypothetical protein